MGNALQRGMVVAVAIEEQRRQVKDVELAGQGLGVAGIHLKQRQVVVVLMIDQQLFPGATTAAALAREHDQRYTPCLRELVMETELVE